MDMQSLLADLPSKPLESPEFKEPSSLSLEDRETPPLSRIPNIRRLCNGLDRWPHFERIIFVPTEFDQWQDGGIVFDPRYTDRYEDGTPVSLCSQFLTFLLGRNDKPLWLNEHRLEFIDLRYGRGSLYFFQAAQGALGAGQPSEVIRLSGRELPPELLDLVNSNFDVKDIAQARRAAKGTEFLPLNEHVCGSITLDFQLYADSSQLDVQTFQARTLPQVRYLLRECNRAGKTVKQVIVNPIGDGDPAYFFAYAGSWHWTEQLMMQAEELVFTQLVLSRANIGSLQSFLGRFVRLKLVVQKLFMWFRANEMGPFDYRDRVYVRRAVCRAQSRPGDVRALTSNPVESFECQLADEVEDELREELQDESEDEPEQIRESEDESQDESEDEPEHETGNE
jgi:hypothetical protein